MLMTDHFIMTEEVQQKIIDHFDFNDFVLCSLKEHIKKELPISFFSKEIENKTEKLWIVTSLKLSSTMIFNGQLI